MSRKPAALAAASLLLLVFFLAACSSTPATALRKIAVEIAQNEATPPLLSAAPETDAATAGVDALSRKKKKKKPEPQPPSEPPAEPPSPPLPPPPPSPKDKHASASAFSLLAASYSLLGAVAAVQLYRIHARVPEFGWTTQKVFHALNAAVCLLRAAGFALHPYLESRAPAALAEAVFDAPGLLFFTTYTLLVLFWAEIYHQARVRERLGVFFFLGGGRSAEEQEK